METERSSNGRVESVGVPSSVTIEVEGVQTSGAGSAFDDEAVGSGGGFQRRLLALAGLAVLAGLLAVLIGSSTPSPKTAAPSTTEVPDASPSVEPAPVESETPFIDQLPGPPESWVAGLVLGWVDTGELLQLRAIDSGDALPAKQLADNILPPLPDHIRLLGGRNATWMIDLEEPRRSGKLSNSVQMVRLGNNRDSYGFISSIGALNRFFVGSLWGPAMNGTAETPASSTVLTVPRTGIVVSTISAESSRVVGGGLDPLPTRLGRVVVASEARLGGIHCDDLGRCIGRIVDWDGANEVEVPAETLARPVVRLSPDGTHLVGVRRGPEPGTSSWIAHDLRLGTVRTWELPVSVDASLVWSPRSDVVFWLDGDALVALNVADAARPVAQVREVGPVGPRLGGSELLVLEGPTTPAG